MQMESALALHISRWPDAEGITFLQVSPSAHCATSFSSWKFSFSLFDQISRKASAHVSTRTVDTCHEEGRGGALEDQFFTQALLVHHSSVGALFLSTLIARKSTVRNS